MQEHLEEVGVELVCSLPGVGASLTDHLHVPLSYRVAGGVTVHSHTNICEGSLFVKLQPDAVSPDLQVFLLHRDHCSQVLWIHAKLHTFTVYK